MANTNNNISSHSFSVSEIEATVLNAANSNLKTMCNVSEALLDLNGKLSYTENSITRDLWAVIGGIETLVGQRVLNIAHSEAVLSDDFVDHHSNVVQIHNMGAAIDAARVKMCDEAKSCVHIFIKKPFFLNNNIDLDESKFVTSDDGYFDPIEASEEHPDESVPGRMVLLLHSMFKKFTRDILIGLHEATSLAKRDVESVGNKYVRYALTYIAGSFIPQCVHKIESDLGNCVKRNIAEDLDFNINH